MLIWGQYWTLRACTEGFCLCNSVASTLFYAIWSLFAGARLSQT